ncbi:AlpA family transcriptional regulator [Cellulomonas sp. KRMCY2]|uniref:helix-turn-helix transcriptional regulator n=1 Tax=Cellulomonas sp. KRMCY2 TaxID=1304865 RepID=UPI00045E903F|nr:helix-turn-helix domain-containing protein [Cellulomonas sp. KRMCY2]
MSAPTTLRVTIPTRRRPQPEQVLDITVTPDDRLLLSIPEAAHRIGISRSQMYNLIAAGRVPVVHIGRSAKIRVEALTAFVQSLPQARG